MDSPHAPLCSVPPATRTRPEQRSACQASTGSCRSLRAPCCRHASQRVCVTGHGLCAKLPLHDALGPQAFVGISGSRRGIRRPAQLIARARRARRPAPVRVRRAPPSRDARRVGWDTTPCGLPASDFVRCGMPCRVGYHDSMHSTPSRWSTACPPLPHPHGICAGTGPTPCAHLRRDWACTGNGVQLTAELTRLTDEVDRLHREWADPHSKARACETAHSCAPPNACTSATTGLGLPTSAPGQDPPLPHLHRDWAHPSHGCSGTIGLTVHWGSPRHTAPGLRSMVYRVVRPRLTRCIRCSSRH
jgi:hypothetical protein